MAEAAKKTTTKGGERKPRMSAAEKLRLRKKKEKERRLALERRLKEAEERMRLRRQADAMKLRKESQEEVRRRKRAAMPVMYDRDQWMEDSDLQRIGMTGRMIYIGVEYILVDKTGKALWKTMEMGMRPNVEEDDPIDMIRAEFIGHYMRLGRRSFMAILKYNRGADADEMWEIMKMADADYKSIYRDE